MVVFSIFSFCWLYHVPVLMKVYAMFVLLMHFFLLDESKGGEKLENGKFITLN